MKKRKSPSKRLNKALSASRAGSLSSQVNRKPNHELNDAALTVYVVEDDAQVLKLLTETLKSYGLNAKGFTNAEELMAEFPILGINPSNAPDLFIVDLELGVSRKTGIDLIKDLATKDTPSEVLAISGYFPSSDVIDNLVCFGSSTILTKPFGLLEVCTKAEQLAKVGRNRRLRRLREDSSAVHISDPQRACRPVFLSYSHEDGHIASGIRRHVESNGVPVWYAPSNIDKGSEWRGYLELGVDKAAIFVPLLTDSYFRSPFCMGEYARFMKRLSNDSEGQLLFLPVLGAVSEEAKRTHCDLKYICQKYQCINFYPRIVDGLTALLMTIERALQRKKAGARLH